MTTRQYKPFTVDDGVGRWIETRERRRAKTKEQRFRTGDVDLFADEWDEYTRWRAERTKRWNRVAHTVLWAGLYFALFMLAREYFGWSW